MTEGEYYESLTKALEAYRAKFPGIPVGGCKFENETWTIVPEREGYRTFRPASGYMLADGLRSLREVKTLTDLESIIRGKKMEPSRSVFVKLRADAGDARIQWSNSFVVTNMNGQMEGWLSGLFTK